MQFIYADTQTTAEVAIGPLTPEMLSVLSLELKRELRNGVNQSAAWQHNLSECYAENKKNSAAYL